MAPSTWKVGANWNQNPVDGKNPAPVDTWFIFIHVFPNISKVSTIQGGAGLLPSKQLVAPLRMLQLPGPHLHLAKALWPLQWGLAPGPARPRYHALWAYTSHKWTCKVICQITNLACMNIQLISIYYLSVCLSVYLPILFYLSIYRTCVYIYIIHKHHRQ